MFLYAVFSEFDGVQNIFIFSYLQSFWRSEHAYITNYLETFSISFRTGSEIVSTFDNPEKVKLGHCDLIEEVIIGEDKLLRFSGNYF